MSDKFIHNGQWHVMESCYTCKVKHSFPLHIYEAAIQRRGSMSIYCPNGHAWVYSTEQQISENEKVRQERDRLRQQLAQKNDEIQLQRDLKEHERNRVIAFKGVITKTKKRISGGACPCCNRTFQNLARHMATKHKDYANSEEMPDSKIKHNLCSRDGCESTIEVKGRCMKHYHEDYRAKVKAKSA